MTHERRGGSGLAVPTARLGGRSERRRSTLAAAVIGLATVSVVAIGWLGGQSKDRSATAAAAASALAGHGTSPSQRPIATPRAAEIFWSGPHPGGEIALQAPDVGLVDLATGHLTRVARDPARGALVPSEAGAGWICICTSVVEGAPPVVTRVDLVHISDDATVVRHTIIADLRPAGDASVDVATGVDVAVSRDQRWAYLATSLLTGAGWQIGLERFDLKYGAVPNQMEVLTVPRAVIPGLANRDIHPDVHASGPSIRLSPDGRTLIGWAAIDERSPTGAVHSQPLAWVVDIDADGTFGQVRQLATPAATAHPCDWTGFATPDVIVTVCPFLSLDDSGRMAGTDIDVRTWRPDGSQISSATIAGGFLASYGQPVIDQTHGLVYIWDPHRSRLLLIDVHDGFITVVPDLTIRQTLHQAFWSRPDSSLAADADGLLVGDPVAHRLYALALSTDAGASPPGASSIVVLDADTQRVLDRWPVQGVYASLGVSPNGRWLVAGAAAGQDDVNAGLPSMAVHDPATGIVAAWFSGLDLTAPPLLGLP
ncbi:MAG: hypothetical protein ACRDF7_07195 [Candidatus Limnocylindrales bacterium]